MNFKHTYVIVLLLMTSLLSAQSINQFDDNDERHGVWRKNYHKTRLLRYEGQFEHGKEVGTFKYYKIVNSKSVLTAKKEFNAANSEAVVTFYSSKGKVISKGKMNGQFFIGQWTYYHNKTKTIMSTEIYNDKGELDGEKTVYYKTGQIAEKTIYVNNKKEGLSTCYSERGVVIKVYAYENDELHGISKFYDGDGNLVAEGRYKRGRKDGIWSYYENGKLIDKKDFTKRSKNPKKQ